MQAVIMAGGFGTRLRPLTNNIPKPMVPIVNKPILEHLISLLKIHNIKEYIVLLYYEPEIISNFLKDGQHLDVDIKYILPDRDYGTAGAVKLSEKYITDDFLVISGDVLTNFNLSEFHNFHKEKNSTATISLYSSENPLQYGIVLMDNDNKIVRFLEKPSSSEVFSDTINTGIYYFSKEIFNYIPEGENFDFSGDLFPLLLGKGIPLYGFKSNGYWRDVGNLEEYIYANLDSLKGTLGYIQERDYYGNCISGTAKIDHDVIIENSILGENVVLEKGSVVKNSVIWNNVKIGQKVSLLYDVIGCNCIIGQNTRINDFVFIGDNVKIGKNAFISSSIKIWDEKEVEDNVKVTKSLIHEDTFFGELFTDSRITGSSNLQINPEFGAKLGAVYGAYVGRKKKVLIARDVDDVSNLIKRAISSGLLSSGVEVIDLQMIPIPIMRQELKGGTGFGGIFIRKSPFDKEVTDIIFFGKDGKDLPSSKTKAIERLFFSEEYERVDFKNVGTIRYPERTNEKYKQHFLSSLDINAIKKKKFKIVIDYSFGIASTIFPNILGEFNCEIVSLSAHLDKHQMTRTAEQFKKAMDNFCYAVKSLNFDMGFMIDAGGEKIWLARNDGHLLDDDRFLCFVLKLFLMVTPEVKKIAVPVQASTVIDQIAEEYGTEVIRVKNTHYSMMQACEDKEVKFVGGTKRGFLFPEFLYATDGMFSIAKILEMIAKSGTTFQDIDSMIRKFYIKKVNIITTKEDKGRILRKFMEDTIQYRQILIDGVKIYLNDFDSVLCMPDRSRNLVHINVETDSEEKSTKLLEEYKRIVESYMS